MAFQESSMFCEACRRQVLCRRETANHVLHALITIFCTAGLWIPIWLLCALDTGPWRCSGCGSTPTLKQQASWAGASLLKFVAIVTAIGGATIAIVLGPFVWDAIDQARRKPRARTVTQTRPAETPTPTAALAAPGLSARAHLRDAVSDGREPVSYLVHAREDHSAPASGDRARAFAAGTSVVILEDGGEQVRVSVRGFEGWVEASAVERD